MSAKPAKRFSKTDWLHLGLTRLSDHGASALTLEQICEAAGKTRGSFYHHFDDHAVFLRDLVEEWRRLSTLALIDDAEVEPDAAAKLNKLNRSVLEIDEALERGVRTLADQEPTLRASVQAVDDERVAYLAALYRRSAPELAKDALTIAEIEYAAYIGHLIVWPKASLRQRSEAARMFGSLVRRAFAQRDD